MRNNNGASIRRLSNRSLKNNRMRNVFAVMAIILTAFLFTAAFSLVSGVIQASQESTMREVGTRAHAGIKDATTEQYEKIAADPLVKKSNYTIFIGMADNIIKHQAELRFIPDEDTLSDMFITLEDGHMPVAENEIIVDTFVLDELQLPYSLGEKIPLTFSFMGQEITDEFTVCGYYQGDYIAHASELFLSESYWTKLKGSLTDDDFLNWGIMHPEDNGVGLISGNLYFDNESHIEENVRTVIENAGYEPGTEVKYGVNWAYMSSRMESIDPFSIIILFTALAVILITGYLIIYNIFQISVINDIRFYGLLKTIGTTKKQLHRLIRRQAAILSIIGIPIGLILGYAVGKIILPFALSIGDYSGITISLQLNPMIFIFSAAFSAFTVFLSSQKPGKAAGSVSPIEAVKFTQAGKIAKKSRKKLKEKKRRSHFNTVSFAFSNMGRNKRTTAVVIMAISLSIILLAIITTAVGSFQINQYMEQRIAGDFMLGNINVTGTSRSGIIDIDPEYLALADNLEGLTDRQEMWSRYGSHLQIDDKALEQFRRLDAEDKLRREMYTEEKLGKILNGEKTSLDNIAYAYTNGLLSKINVLEGTFDIDKFMSGNYVLLTQILGNDFIAPKEHIYHPGDIVTIEKITKDSIFHEITDESGATIDVEYENLSAKEYEVMAIVEIPSSMNLHRYSANSCDIILPLSEFDFDDQFTNCFAVSYQVEEDYQAAFEEIVKAYSDSHPDMGYVSQSSLREEFTNMITVVATIGIMLAAVIALIGILNFINAITTEIISRKQEFAILQSIGMTNTQLKKTLICEGISYVVISGIISFIAGSFLSWMILNALNDVILFFEYHFQILPFVIMIPLLVIVAILAPLFAYRNIRQKSIVERLRENE